jgi:hypothetical protein
LPHGDGDDKRADAARFAYDRSVAGGRAKFSIAAGAVILLAASAPGFADEKDDFGGLLSVELAPTVVVHDSGRGPSAAAGGRFVLRGGPLVTPNVAVTLGVGVDFFTLKLCGVDTPCETVFAENYALRLEVQGFVSRRWWLRGGIGFDWFRRDVEYYLGDEGGSGPWFAAAVGVDALRDRYVALTVSVELAEVHLLGDTSGDFFSAALLFGLVLRTPAPRD